MVEPGHFQRYERESIVRLGLARCVVAVMLVAGVTACEADSDPNDPRIVAPPDLDAGVALKNTTPQRPYVFRDLTICLDRSGEVTVESVESKDTFGDLTLDAFALVPAQQAFQMDQTKSISEQGKEAGRGVLAFVCSTNLAISQVTAASPPIALVLQYSRPTDTSAGNHGITVHYTSGGHKYSTFLKYTAILCAPGDKTTEHCG